MGRDTDKTGVATQRDPSRRDLFRQAGAAGAAAAIGGAPLCDTEAKAQHAPAASATMVLVPRREALETLTAAEADMLEAIVARLIPTDENGPGAAEARAAYYIDRALTGPLRGSRAAYADGLAALDVYAQASRARRLQNSRRATRTQCSPTSSAMSPPGSRRMRRRSSPCCAPTPSRAPSATRITAATRISSAGT